MGTSDKTFDMEMLFKALADRTRLRLLNLMTEGEICVCFFTEILRESQPKVSRHLAYLRRAGVVKARRDGKWMHYQIVIPKDSDAASVLDATIDWLRRDPAMRRDLQHLTKVCCAPKLPVQLLGAPKPTLLKNDEG